MKLTNAFWKRYELDLQEVKIAYLNWAIDYMVEPSPRYRHLFLWEDYQTDFCIVNSRYGRAFSISPFGVGVRGVPNIGIRSGIDEADMALKSRLASSTQTIRTSIAEALEKGNLDDARQTVLNYQMLKLSSAHEILYDKIQYRRDSTGKRRKGRWGLDESEGWNSLTGIRNRIVNVIRYGEDLEDTYVENLNRKLPGFSRNSRSTFLSSAMTWNKYAMCAFDCGPVLWSKSGFVDFSMVKHHMNEVGWPYKSTALKILKPFYRIALDYTKSPICNRKKPNQGYDLDSIRQKRGELYELLDDILNAIHEIRSGIQG